jgi:hypothetical protein
MMKGVRKIKDKIMRGVTPQLWGINDTVICNSAL